MPHSEGGTVTNPVEARVRPITATREAMDRHGPPDVFNTDQGAQFTSADFVSELETRGVGSAWTARVAS